ncbi:uncharacterized protein LAESUDRAFT_209398 [Laetiporus sulphureus 93-53]|uniref:Uncharacterized protein n=1 Tax=Laetiporus sulphureus 93-53 TaxID=1314785 RepID=A0A165E077_9APHY|nr:uncharacterized protein LAESUDRAFT_209398 [Laetiporus sulphureus 93-53]KZT05995.1 hypothetical protein LAESUDRAFT_209398 [Laetiporus sulphureus 93-53]
MSPTTIITLSSSTDQIEKEAKKDVAAAFPDEASKEKAGQDLSKTLNDPEVKKRAYEDVKSLAKTIREIRAGFVKVAGDFVGFDAAEFKDKNGTVIQLGKKWRPYIQRFDDTLQYSLQQATEAVVMMKSTSFISTVLMTFLTLLHTAGINSVLGAVTPDLGSDLRVELESFMEQLKKKEGQAILVKGKFTQLADDVRIFMKEVDVALDKAEEAIKIDLEKAQNRLSDLKQQLEDLEAKIKALTIATVSEVVAGVGAAAVAIFTLNPVAIFASVGSFIAAIGTGIALAKAKKEKEKCQEEIVKVNKEIEYLQERQELLKKYRKSLEESKNTISEVSTKIETIANIWNTINLDMHALHTSLHENIADGRPITKFFIAKLGVAKDIYSHLILLLETYVEEVRAVNKN